MAVRRRTALLTAGWLVCGILLGSLGCQAEVTYRIGSGKKRSVIADPALSQGMPVNPGDPVAYAPHGSAEVQQVVAPVPAALAGAPVAPPSCCSPGGPDAGPQMGPHGPGPDMPPIPVGPPPRELDKVAHPPYRIEPPDILVLDAVRLIPRPPYVIEPFDVLLIQVTGTVPDQPILGAYTVTPDGTVALGFSYGSVRVSGMTLEEAQAAIQKHLTRLGLTRVQVAVSLGQFRGIQQTRGEHLVRPDGTISLGTYGCVFVTGLTLGEAKCAIERQLSHFLLNPEVSVDVFAYNSKVYYVITDGAGYGEQVYRFPVTGNETVLDALSNINGLPAVASKRKIWLARPAPADHSCLQILPVDWRAITQGGATATNYQIFPGDRIYVKAQCLITFDNTLAKILAPVERVLGITLLGASVFNSFDNNGFNNNNNVPFIVLP